MEADAHGPRLEASGSRRRPVEAPTRFAALRAEQVRIVGAAFLRARPLIVTPVAVANAVLLMASGAPAGQCVAAGSGLGIATAVFWAERIVLRDRTVTDRWLVASLGTTLLLLAIGCAVTGGLASPMTVLLATPVVIGAAAFGRTRITGLLLTGALGVAVLLAVAPPLFPRPPAPAVFAMTVIALAAMLTLGAAGIASLVAAHSTTGELLDRMRIAALDEAASRIRATEQQSAKVAHELKNPLAGIKALLQLARGGAVPAKVAERLDVALGEVDRMAGIVRDYLAFARPVTDLEFREVEMRALAHDVVTVLAARAELAGVLLAVRGPAVHVRADERRLREALTNLADNALAASPRGSTVEIAIAAAGSGVRVTIDDAGAGIPAGAGVPFVTTKADGTGLGLTIARAAIEQHGGELCVAPRPGSGTRAELVVPTREVRA